MEETDQGADKMSGMCGLGLQDTCVPGSCWWLARQLERKEKPGGQHGGWFLEQRALITGAPHIGKKPVSQQGLGPGGWGVPAWGEAPQAGCAISRDKARSHRDSWKCASCVCWGGEGCCPGRDPSALCSPGSPALAHPGSRSPGF